MKKVFPTYRTDLALGKEPREGNRSHALLHNVAVMMAVAEKAFASPATAEQQRAQRRVSVLGTIRCEKDMQVVAGGFAITKLKLNRLAFLYDIPDGDCAGLLVRTDEVANEKISTFEPTPVFIDGDADM